MRTPYLPFGPFILVAITQDSPDEAIKKSPLFPHYDLGNMITNFRKTFSNDINQARIENYFLKTKTALPRDTEKVNEVLNSNCDLDEKAKKLVCLYKEVHSNSCGLVIITLSQLLYAKKQWFEDCPNEAAKIFPNHTFDEKFFEHRRNILCLFAKKASKYK